MKYVSELQKFYLISLIRTSPSLIVWIDATETPIERPKKAKAFLLGKEEKAHSSIQFNRWNLQFGVGKMSFARSLFNAMPLAVVGLSAAFTQAKL